MPINSFKDLIVWQKSMDLIPTVYDIASKLPSEERYGLTSQLHRSVISIPSNIAEGTKRGSRADFRQFCKVASGSAAELETQLLAVQLIYFINTKPALDKLIEIQKMLTKLNQKLDKKQTSNYKLKTIN